LFEKVDGNPDQDCGERHANQDCETKANPIEFALERASD
jgi:hypothetical protein